MSGEKRTYVSVEERELRRLREQESCLRTVNRDLPERLNAIRQQRQEKMVKGLQSDLSRLEKDTQQRLARQHRNSQTVCNSSGENTCACLSSRIANSPAWWKTNAGSVRRLCGICRTR
ncbi:MAG: hypothetical protein V2I97_23080 [Desulfococcaceae bacterium]|jgi:TolA-binding protein|nr:hypothetical protein [Desulfococcaceae bacterium]